MTRRLSTKKSQQPTKFVGHELTSSGSTRPSKRPKRSNRRSQPDSPTPPTTLGQHTAQCPAHASPATVQAGALQSLPSTSTSSAPPPPRLSKTERNRKREAEAFREWTSLIDTLVPPFLAATRGQLPSPSLWSALTCSCPAHDSKVSTFQLNALDTEELCSLSIQSCSGHIIPLLIRNGLFPATPSQPRTAFSFALLRFFRALQGQTRIGSAHLINALLYLYQEGTSKMKPYPKIPSKDMHRKEFRAAFGWFKALEARCQPLVFKDPQDVVAPYRRPALEEDDLCLSVQDLAARCPACFGGLVRPLPDDTHGSTTATGQALPSRAALATLSSGSPHIIVCLDGNFQHKRLRKNDAVVRSQAIPSYFLSTRQIHSARQRFEASTSRVGPDTGCGANIKAAVDGTSKTTLGPFDIGGVMGLTCRHGAPLAMADIMDSGESHYYAYALLHLLLSACGKNLASLGVCYDIGCKLAVAPRMLQSITSEFSAPVHFAVSIFHVYGHDYDCQIKYSPRRCPGFGWTDGESLERLWSTLRDLVSFTRPMTRVNRRQTLCNRLDKISREHLHGLIAFLQDRMLSIRHRLNIELQQFQELSKAVSVPPGLTAAPTAAAPPASAAATPTLFTAAAHLQDADTRVSFQTDPSLVPPPTITASDLRQPHSNQPASVLSIAPRTCVSEPSIDLPGDLGGVVSYLSDQIKARRQVAYDRKAVQGRYLQRISKLLEDPAFSFLASSQASGPEPLSNEAVPQPLAQPAPPTMSAAHLLLKIVARQKSAIESLSGAALALHTPLTQWHGITDQMARRDLLPSTHLLSRHTTSKSTCSTKARAALAKFNQVVHHFNRVLSENEAMKSALLAQPQSQFPDGKDPVPHPAPVTSTHASHRQGVKELQEHRSPLPAHSVPPASLFERSTLALLAPLVNPDDLAHQPWATDATLATTMDALERIHRFYEELERIRVEVDNSISWLSSQIGSTLRLQQPTRPSDHHILIDRRLSVLQSIGLHWLVALRRVKTGLTPHPVDLASSELWASNIQTELLPAATRLLSSAPLAPESVISLHAELDGGDDASDRGSSVVDLEDVRDDVEADRDHVTRNED